MLGGGCCLYITEQLTTVTYLPGSSPLLAFLWLLWLFVNTMQTLPCGCVRNRKKNPVPEQVNTSFIIPFVWRVYCVLFLVNRLCLIAVRRGGEPFLELSPFVLSLWRKLLGTIFYSVPSLCTLRDCNKCRGLSKSPTHSSFLV